MSRDLTDMYAALGAEADAVPLPSAEGLRRGADRRARVFTTALCLVAIVVVGGLAVAVRPYFVRVTPSVGSTPPTEIPTSAFLVMPPDLVDPNDPVWHEAEGFPLPTPTPSELPTVCGSPAPGLSKAVHLKVRSASFKLPAGSEPTGAVGQQIITFSDGGAATYLTDLRALLGNGCTEEEEIVVRPVDDERRGDDSILIEVSDRGQVQTYQWVIRIGDVLTVITVLGYESIEDRATADNFADLGYAAFRAWLGY
jgi:hypothetical protein